jgi:hypothetical protein
MTLAAAIRQGCLLHIWTSMVKVTMQLMRVPLLPALLTLLLPLSLLLLLLLSTPSPYQAHLSDRESKLSAAEEAARSAAAAARDRAAAAQAAQQEVERAMNAQRQQLEQVWTVILCPCALSSCLPCAHSCAVTRPTWSRAAICDHIYLPASFPACMYTTQPTPSPLALLVAPPPPPLRSRAAAGVVAG